MAVGNCLHSSATLTSFVDKAKLTTNNTKAIPRTNKLNFLIMIRFGVVHLPGLQKDLHLTWQSQRIQLLRA